jgi:4-amino-4-deoxy-L-arabinose transferase-like glycosyltransferase
LLGSLAALTAVRLAAAASAPLAPDEAYYWVFSRALAPGYLDHPPMVALWVRAGTALLGQNALGVRLLGPLAAALGSVLLYDAAEHLFPARRAGAVAAMLWNATLLAGVGAVIMTPDTPLLFFWTACLWALAKLLHSNRPVWWLAIGLFAGCALASKYTALLLWIGIGVWLLVVPALRRWWRSPVPWASAVLGALVFLPVVAWNAHHHWISFLRQGGRVESWQPERAPQFLAELLGGQLGLATPLLFPLFVAGAAWATRRTWRDRDPAWTLLAALILPGLVVFVQHALGARVQGNWPAILYPAAAIAAAALDAPMWRRLRGPAVGLGLVLTLLVYVQATTFALALPPRLDPIAHQLAGWPGLASSVDAARRQQGEACVVADEYATAAELAWSLPRDVTVVALGPRWRFFALPAPRLGESGCVLVGGAHELPSQGWHGARRLDEVGRNGDGATIQRFSLWRVAGVPPSLPAAVLPR